MMLMLVLQLLQLMQVMQLNVASTGCIASTVLLLKCSSASSPTTSQPASC
jgi:hypothetical protein